MEILKIEVGTEPDFDPDPSYLDQAEFADAKAAYERGEFSFVGVRASADIVVNGVCQEIKSGGIWGVDDWGDRNSQSYIRELEGDQLDELDSILSRLGFTADQIAAAR